MSLKSDELNAMIKQAAIQNLNIQIPVNTKDIEIEKEKEEKDISDTEYIEDYLDNKYNKMVKMAQAYSDYGVVYGKSDSNNNNNVNNKFKTTEQEDFKLKLPFDKQNLVNRFFRKLDRGFVLNFKVFLIFRPAFGCKRNYCGFDYHSEELIFSFPLSSSKTKRSAEF